MSFARILIFALALTHAVGLADLLMDDSCEEVCADDGCNDCVPGVACRCHCPSTMPLLGGGAQTVAKLNLPREIPPALAIERLYASPDPREILHVPKRVV